MSAQTKQQPTNEQILGKAKAGVITVTLIELVNSQGLFQQLMRLPKPSDVIWKLSYCFNAEIKPAIEQYNETLKELYERYGVKDPDGTPNLTKASDENKRAFTEEQTRLWNQPVEIHLERISATKIIKFIDNLNKNIKANNEIAAVNGQPLQPEIYPTTEFMISWLFVG